MKLGFTGTKEGMNNKQKKEFTDYLFSHPEINELHHGDCVGADADAHNIAISLGIRVIIHPPTDSKHRAGCPGHEIRKEKTYLVRNHDIVDETDALFAAPYTDQEIVRSGTWATVRYGKKRQFYPITISYPQGVKW